MHERSAGVIVFRKVNDKLLYLLLHYKHGRGYWCFSKGHLENGETEKIAAIRELNEESGITEISLIDVFTEKINYHFMNDNERSFKEVTYFLAETKQKNVTISDEHIGFVWVDFEKAMEMIAFENTREVLKKANNLVFRG